MKVFISHSSNDKKFVRTLKRDLQENGVDTFLDEDTLEIGDSLKERLDMELDKCSHFMIILTPSSVNSNWVKYELDKANKMFLEKLLKKIIPIKYRDCDIPVELSKLLYEDLSKEIVFSDGDYIKFASDGYPNFLIKLIKTLGTTDKKLSLKDKSDLKKDVTESEERVEKSFNKTFRSSHKIIKYKNANAANYYKQRIKNRNHKLKLKMDDLKPILLPPIYQNIFSNLEYGDIIILRTSDDKTDQGHFAGFRSEDGITLFHSIRKTLNITPGLFYRFDVDIKSRTFTKLDTIQ